MSYAPQSSPGSFRLPAWAVGLGLLLAVPARAATQDSIAPADPTSPDATETGRETALHATPAPDAPPIATLPAGTAARVVGQVDGWKRVQVEGWVRDADIRPSAGAALVGVTAAEVRAKPDRYIGRALDWRLQFIAVQVADELRPEMAPGQPYLLTRGPIPEAGFVYVILSSAEAERFRALPPLEELTLRVKVRAPRTRYLETPVVELAAVVAGGKRVQP